MACSRRTGAMARSHRTAAMRVTPISPCSTMREISRPKAHSSSARIRPRTPFPATGQFRRSPHSPRSSRERSGAQIRRGQDESREGHENPRKSPVGRPGDLGRFASLSGLSRHTDGGVQSDHHGPHLPQSAQRAGARRLRDLPWGGLAACEARGRPRRWRPHLVPQGRYQPLGRRQQRNVHELPRQGRPPALAGQHA